MARRSLTEPPAAPARPGLAAEPSRFMQLEREVEQEYRPLMLAALQRKVDAVAEEVGSKAHGASGYSRGYLAGALRRLTGRRPALPPLSL